MKRDNRRKIVLISRSFQYRMIAKFILLNIMIMILFSGLLYLFLDSEIGANLNSAHITYRNIKEMLFPIIISISVINIFVSSIIIGVFVLFASFRIAGPLYRFNEAIKEICNRNLRPATSIREGDQLYDCSATLKEMSEVIAADFSGIKHMLDEIKDLLKKDSSQKKVAKKIQELDVIVNQYKL